MGANNLSIRPLAIKLAEHTRRGKFDRREFIALASSLELISTSANGLLEPPSPAAATGSEVKLGGTLKIAKNIMDINDPRTYEWSKKANVASQSVGRWCARDLTKASNQCFWKAGMSLTTP